VRVGREPAADLTPEPIEVLLVEAMLEEGAGVDAGGGVTLEVDVVGGRSVPMAEEAKVERWPPIPSASWLALITITAAFQRTKRRMRRSRYSSPGNHASCSAGIVLM
jgi:hypothetical protein